MVASDLTPQPPLLVGEGSQRGGKGIRSWGNYAVTVTVASIPGWMVQVIL
jgi:hypothetical protein